MNRPTADQYKEIALAAITKNESRVRELLSFGVHAQLAQLFTEQIHSDAVGIVYVLSEQNIISNIIPVIRVADVP